ncbi:MAG: CPBP family intramembrane metalloprotease [Firmicutes bacterium]|nr:CPBP family intramembrane metalloprotease [Bacillota bacterium]
MKISNKQIKIYLITAFGLAYILQIIASIFRNQGNETVFTVIMAVCMFMPLLGALVARVPFKGMGWLPKLKGKIRYVFFALWMPAVLSTIGGILFFILFPHTKDLDFMTLRNLFESSGVMEQMEAQGITIPMYILITTVGALTYAPFINMIPSLGEEVGWRGVLYPYLKDKYGKNKGRIFGGTIWGMWHWPCMILAGYEYGKEYIGAPVLGLFVFCMFTIAMGILLDYVYEKTEVIWIPSLMHGAINAFTIFMYLIKPEYSHMSVLGPGFIGLIGMIPMVVMAIYLCEKKK